MLNRLGGALERLIGSGIKALGFVACILLGLMLLIYGVNVVGRYVFNSPLLGAEELIDVGMAGLVFFGLSYTALKKGHVSVELLTPHLPRRVRAITGSITLLLGAGFWAIVGWQAGVRTWTYIFKQGETTDIIRIPLAPFVFLTFIGCYMLCLQLLVDFGHSVMEVSKTGRQ